MIESRAKPVCWAFRMGHLQLGELVEVQSWLGSRWKTWLHWHMKSIYTYVQFDDINLPNVLECKIRNLKVWLLDGINMKTLRTRYLRNELSLCIVSGQLQKRKLITWRLGNPSAVPLLQILVGAIVRMHHEWAYHHIMYIKPFNYNIGYHFISYHVIY